MNQPVCHTAVPRTFTLHSWPVMKSGSGPLQYWGHLGNDTDVRLASTGLLEILGLCWLLLESGDLVAAVLTPGLGQNELGLNFCDTNGGATSLSP